MISQDHGDETNFVELFLRFWAYKFLFLTVMLIFVVFAIVYINFAQKIYTSNSIFIPEKQTSNQTLGNVVSSELVSLIGLSPESSSTEEWIERFTGRKFVLEVAAELNLSNDQFFNSYDPKASKPIWKEKLKELIGWESSSLNPVKIAEWNVLQSFQKHILLTETEAGAIEVKVQHFNPQRAAEINNHITNKIISVLKSENIQANDDKVNYLSERLADSLINLENAQEKLKQFMLLNSTSASASFYKNSLILDNLRTQQEDGRRQISTIDVLLSYTAGTAGSSPTFQDYLTLRNKHPLLDKSDFRRLLGISEIGSAWSWPSVETLKRVRNSLQNRSSSLQSEIRMHEEEAKKYAMSAGRLAELTREVKVAEATHQVLLAQVTTSSITAGFTPDTAQIISAANVEILATKPNKMLVLTLAPTFGFFVSATLALILSWKQGVLYSSGELLKAINPKFYHKIRTLKYYRTSSFNETQERVIQQPVSWLKQLCLETLINQGPSPIVIADTTNTDNAAMIARLLAVSGLEFGLSIAYIDLSKIMQFKDKTPNDQASETIIDLKAAESSNGCTEYNYLGGKRNSDWLFSKSFQETFNALNAKHDTIIMSANSDALELLHSSGKLHEAKLVIHASKGKITYENIKKLNAQGNIEVALLS